MPGSWHGDKARVEKGALKMETGAQAEDAGDLWEVEGHGTHCPWSLRRRQHLAVSPWAHCQLVSLRAIW